ncbi:MAG: flippase-like domain-containing protein [Flavobacteriales bacterium]|nr:flippase-like domain-containing protein [Flavobacteriales bacterium]
MKRSIVSILKVVLPIALGIFLIWIVARKFTPKDINEIKGSFEKANYGWIFLCIFLGILSHASRAWRWKYTLEPLGIKPTFYNSFFSVMIGYFANMAIPRLGEVSRCAVMAKYEKAPFDKLFGTVIAERVADMLILLTLIITVLFMQFDTLKELFFNTSIGQKLSGPLFYILIAVFLLLGLFLFKLIKNSSLPFFEKIRQLLGGVFEGIRSIINMKQRVAFLFHTLFIWSMYLLMLWVAFFSLEETSQIPFSGVMSCFVMGGITIAATNGGLGAYPLGIQSVLLLYGVTANAGYAFGWIVWTAQAIMLVGLGILSLILVPLFNKNPKA